MIPEKEREALMRLTMCAREECIMCKYHKECDFDYQYETATRCMNILADALRKTEPTQNQHIQSVESVGEDRKTESNSEKPNNSTISKMEQVDEPKLTPNYCGTCKHREVPCGDLPCDVCHGYSNYEPKDEPQIQLTARCLNCNNAKACKEKHWDGCVYEPKDEKTCETCRHWKYIAHEWQCEACKCQGYEPKDEPQTNKGVSYSDHTDYDEPKTYVTWTEPTDCPWK